jgi:hypothetical protein
MFFILVVLTPIPTI